MPGANDADEKGVTIKLQECSIVDSSSKHGGSEAMERVDGTKSTVKGVFFQAVPDEITMNRILPRLPWRSLTVLARLNRGWQAALKRPDVYDARARAISAQIIVTIQQYQGTLCLYDTSNDTWHCLPHPAFSGMLVTLGCSCVFVHGRLYILGGCRPNFDPRNEVHMFDLTGNGQWKQCASMITARKHFACAVKDGKIYVFGGMGAGNAGEVYDPKEDSWREIAPMLSTRFEHKVVAVGDKFCVQMGRYKAPLGYAHSAEVYDPVKDKWTSVENFSVNNSSKAMMAEAPLLIDGKLHRILDDWLYVYDEPVNVGEVLETLKWDGSGSWKAVQPISWDIFKPPGVEHYFNPFTRMASAVVNDGELVAMAFGQTANMSKRKWTLLKSQGLGRKDQTLTWKKIECSVDSLPPGPVRQLCTEDGTSFPFSPCLCLIPGAW